MTADQYLLSIVRKYRITGDVDSLTRFTVLLPLQTEISKWAGATLNDTSISGSRAKGTAIKLSSDIDLFISLKSDTQGNLKDIYNSLYNHFYSKGIPCRRQNVSIGIDYQGHSIDLVPARKHKGNTNDHSLYRSKADSWTQTNVNTHITLVKNSGRLNEIIALKIWRKLHKLEFPSIYLELTVLDALYNRNKQQPANNFLTVLEYLRDSFVSSIVIDPANSNNKLSDDLYKYEKEAIARKATESLGEKSWDGIIW